MKYLIDTHIFLWFVNNDSNLSAPIKALLESNVILLLSVASLWEIAIKMSLGKISLPDSFDRFISQQIALNKIDVLPIETAHLSVISNLPFHHKDPFDRLIIAQAITEKVSVITVDSAFDAYPIQKKW
jgi:PIN domain nuclease of toxin-antitoxin system